jgi:hypothetical protein
VTSESHRALVEENFTQQSQEKGYDFNKIFLHQYGARPGTDNSVTPTSVTETFLHTMALDLGHGGFGHHYYLLTLNSLLFFVCFSKGNVREIVHTVSRMTKLKCVVPDNTNIDVLRR